MENTQPTIQDLIAQLPISDEDKQRLTSKAEAEGEEAIKPEIGQILGEAAAMVQYKQEVDEIAADAERQVAAAQQEVHEQYVQASKDIDALELEHARNTIAEQ